MANETNVNLTKMSNIPVFTGDIDHWIGGSATTAKSWADAAAESAANAQNSAILAQQMKEAVDDSLRTPDTVVYGGLDQELYWCQQIVLKRESLPSGDVLDIGIHIPAYDTLNVNMMQWIKPDTNTPWPYYLSIHDLDIVEDRAHYLGWIATSQNANELLMHASSPYELHWRFEGVSLRPGMRLKLRFLPAITQQQEAQYNIGTYTHLDQTDFGAHDNTTKSGYRQLPYIPVLYKNDNAGNGVYKVNASPSETVTVWEPTYSAAVDFSMSADLASVVQKAGDYATEARVYAQQAITSATNAQLSETNAATSATNAAASASTASSKASAAATSANTASSKAAAAATSEANALTYKGQAEAAKTAAEAAKTAAESAKSGADAAKEEATSQAASASTSATTAANKASEASTSATNAAASASSAAASATTAINKAAFATEEANRAEAAATGMQDLYDTTLEAATLAVSAYESSVTAQEASHGFAEEARQAKETAVTAAATVTDQAERAEAAAQTAENIAEEVAASVSTATQAAIEATSSKNIAVTAKNEATAAAISAGQYKEETKQLIDEVFTDNAKTFVNSGAAGTIVNPTNSEATTISWDGTTLKFNGSIQVDGAITTLRGKNINHGAGASTFVSGNDEFNMSVRGFYGGTKINGTLKKSVELTINDDNRASLKLNDAEVRTKEVVKLYSSTVQEADQRIAATLRDGGEYVIESAASTFLDMSSLQVAYSEGSSMYASARLGIILHKTNDMGGGIGWPTGTYWLGVSNPDEAPTMHADETPEGYDGMIYHVVLEKFGKQLTANLAYQRPYKNAEL